MPSRVIRGEIVASESLSKVSIGADLTFRSLIVACDDYGRIDGRLPALKALLFPFRDEATHRKIDGWLDELAAGEDPPIVRYVVDGRPYIMLTGWEKHRGKGRRGSVSKCPEPLPRKSEDCHADPPGNREAGDENREAGIGKRESAIASSDPPASRSSLCPAELSSDELASAGEWAAAKGFTAEQMAYGWERVRDWSHSKRLKRADWLATLRNAMTDGWALKGFGQSPTGEVESPAQARARRTKEAGAKAYELIQNRKLELIGGGGT